MSVSREENDSGEENVEIDSESDADQLDSFSSRPGHGRVWTDVIDELENHQVCWNDLSDQDKLLFTINDDKNASRPSILHKMADNWGMEFSRRLDKAIRQDIVLYLLDKGNVAQADDSVLTIAIVDGNSEFIDFLIAQRPKMIPDLIESKGKNDMNCLHKAFQYKLINARKTWRKSKSDKDLKSTMTMIRTLLKYTSAQALIAKGEQGNTPFHYAMNYKLCLLPMKYKYDNSEYQYSSLISEILFILESDKVALRKLGELFNSDSESPYCHYLSSQRLAHQNTSTKATPKASSREPEPKKNELKKKSSWDSGIKSKLQAEKGSLPKSSSERSESYPPKTQEPARTPVLKGTPLPSERKPGSQGTKKPESEHRQPLNLTEARSEECQNKVAGATVSTTEPPQRSTRTTNQPKGIERANNILIMVRRFLICNCQDRTAKDLLYGKVASDKNLFFDASHLSGKEVATVVKLIDQIAKVGGFEDTLSYVRIPALASDSQGVPKPPQQYSANEKRPFQQISTAEDAKKAKGRETLVDVFNKLVDVGVHRIIRLHVDDNIDEWAHTDAAIERAIRGNDQFCEGETRAPLEIEEWNWCKPDINLGVIKYSAPSVKHIHLHWSGSQAVLDGWASSEFGIPFMRRDKQSLLSKITLHAYQGLEDFKRRGTMIDNFAALIEGGTSRKVEVKKILLPTSIIIRGIDDGGHDIRQGQQADEPRPDAWIEAMEEFRKSLGEIHDWYKKGGAPQEGSPKRVKVALIDDGIELTEFNSYGSARCTGVSFCSSRESDEDAWWKSTCGHGTIMANMITRLNQWVDLEVIKIRSSRSYIHGNGARSISPKSAADAINAAVIRGADIISTSWTITDLEYRMSQVTNKPDDGERAEKSEMKLLRDAIGASVEKNKRILVCSAADDIRLTGENTLPYNAKQESIIRIGASGSQANRDAGSGSGNSIAYYLPGNQVAEDRRPYSAKRVVYHTGSSVSTALASGLMSIIMYSAHFLDWFERQGPKETRPQDAGKKYKLWAEALRNPSNMHKVFETINQYANWTDDKKIVAVWGVFNETAKEIKSQKSHGEKVKSLKALVERLCHNVN